MRRSRDVAHKAIVPVHLYGQAADMTAIRRVAERHKLAIVEDCCQAHLATEGGSSSGRVPTLPRSASIRPRTWERSATADDHRRRGRSTRVRRLRNGGQRDYRHVDAGVNSRLDELQAAVLRARLPLLPAWTARRRQLASQYRNQLPGGGIHRFANATPATCTISSRCACLKKRWIERSSRSRRASGR